MWISNIESQHFLAMSYRQPPDYVSLQLEPSRVRRSTRFLPDVVCPHILHCRSSVDSTVSEYMHFEYMGSFYPAELILGTLSHSEIVVARVPVSSLARSLPQRHLSSLCKLHGIPICRSYRSIDSLTAMLLEHTCQEHCSSCISVFRFTNRWRISFVPPPDNSAFRTDDLGFSLSSSEFIGVELLHQFPLLSGCSPLPSEGYVRFIGHLRHADALCFVPVFVNGCLVGVRSSICYSTAYHGSLEK